MRPSSATSKAADELIRGRVFEVLTQLGLLDVADSLVGDSERRGISGGERCRLSIGLELVAAPDILILDEPTSGTSLHLSRAQADDDTGLDSSSAMKVISVLKSLSSRTTVITTIHQPSSRIFSHFDKLLVLGLGGRVVYCGQADAAGEHFAGMGMSCPEGWNMADRESDTLLGVLRLTTCRQTCSRSPLSPRSVSPPPAPHRRSSRPLLSVPRSISLPPRRSSSPLRAPTTTLVLCPCSTRVTRLCSRRGPCLVRHRRAERLDRRGNQRRCSSLRSRCFRCER